MEACVEFILHGARARAKSKVGVLTMRGFDLRVNGGERRGDD